jgi:hypothetical protein
MWEVLDFRDRSLVRFAQLELWREAAMERLAREVSAQRPSLLGGLAQRLRGRREKLADEAA